MLYNGSVIKIGRGLDFYQKPGSWFAIGVNDLALRKCLETKVDIYRADGPSCPIEPSKQGEGSMARKYNEYWKSVLDVVLLDLRGSAFF